LFCFFDKQSLRYLKMDTSAIIEILVNRKVAHIYNYKMHDTDMNFIHKVRLIFH